MAVQQSTTVRNAVLDAIETAIGTAAVVKIFSGSQPANCAAANTGTELASFTLASDWMAAASSGAKSFSNLPVSTTAIAGAPTNAGHYRIYASNGTTCHEQGSITVAGGGGDMIIDALAITSGQTVRITAYTKTAAHA
jgi:hypothetical protein